MKTKVTIIFMHVLLLTSWLTNGQIVIPAGTNIALGGNPEIVLRSSGNVVNNSGVDFSSSQLFLILNGTSQTITGTIAPKGLALTTPGDQTVNADISCARFGIDRGGQKTYNGNLTVSSEFHLIEGILVPGNSSKILFTGSAEGIKDAGPNSFVDGIFYNSGTELLNFPVGAAGLGFAPVQIETGTGNEIGVRAVNENAGLTPAAQEVELIYIDQTHYWQLYFDPSLFTSRIRIALKNGVPENVSAVVVSANAPGSQAFNLGSYSMDEISVTSLNPFTESIVTIGGSTTVEIQIHDMITPYPMDGKNDDLFIENIGKYPNNKVTLLDRWGVPVKEWTNFSNYSDLINPNSEPFNFSSLSPGNYMCVVEYGDEGQAKKKKSQMITVLKID